MNARDGHDLEDLRPGSTASLSKAIAEADVILSAGASGDDEAVRTAASGGRIAQGRPAASTISAAVAGRTPGPGAIRLSQAMNVAAPVRTGDPVAATVAMRERLAGRRRAAPETIRPVGNQAAVEGEAAVRLTSRAERPAA